jgi:hypothetical protein
MNSCAIVPFGETRNPMRLSLRGRIHPIVHLLDTHLANPPLLVTSGRSRIRRGVFFSPPIVKGSTWKLTSVCSEWPCLPSRRRLRSFANALTRAVRPPCKPRRLPQIFVESDLCKHSEARSIFSLSTWRASPITSLSARGIRKKHHFSAWRMDGNNPRPIARWDRHSFPFSLLHVQSPAAILSLRPVVAAAALFSLVCVVDADALTEYGSFVCRGFSIACRSSLSSSRHAPKSPTPRLGILPSPTPFLATVFSPVIANALFFSGASTTLESPTRKTLRMRFLSETRPKPVRRSELPSHDGSVFNIVSSPFAAPCGNRCVPPRVLWVVAFSLRPNSISSRNSVSSARAGLPAETDSSPFAIPPTTLTSLRFVLSFGRIAHSPPRDFIICPSSPFSAFPYRQT